MRYSTVICVAISLLIGVFTFGQDVHLSQFYTAQLNLNPALGGDHDGDYRLTANYRNQWREINDPIATVMVAFDKKIPFRADIIDAGIIVLQDQFAGFGLQTQKVLLSGAYRKQVGNNQLSGGLQFGMNFKRINADNQTFPNQWVQEMGIFDSSTSNMEASDNLNQSFMDINAGFSWSRTFANFRPTVGIALFHVNRPKDTYSQNAFENLRTRKVFHAEAKVKIDESMSVSPKLMCMWTTKAQDLMVGALVNKNWSNELGTSGVYGGILYRGGISRNADAFIPVIGYTKDNIQAGLSYDITVSDLSGSGMKSAYELSIIYTAPFYKPESLTIPCERY